MTICISRPRPAALMLSEASPIKQRRNTCQWVYDNVDMHTYAKFDQNKPCGSRVVSILLTANERTDGQTDRLAR